MITKNLKVIGFLLHGECEREVARFIPEVYLEAKYNEFDLTYEIYDQPRIKLFDAPSDGKLYLHLNTYKNNVLNVFPNNKRNYNVLDLMETIEEDGDGNRKKIYKDDSMLIFTIMDYEDDFNAEVIDEIIEKDGHEDIIKKIIDESKLPLESKCLLKSFLILSKPELEDCLVGINTLTKSSSKPERIKKWIDKYIRQADKITCEYIRGLFVKEGTNFKQIFDVLDEIVEKQVK